MSSADISIFSPEISNFCYIEKYRLKLHFNIIFLILSTFDESLKVVLIIMIAIVMMSAKLATPDLLILKAFSNKDYDLMISVHDVTNSCVVLWPCAG